MKTIIASFLVLLTAVWSTVSAQDWPEEYLGLPGDNLNLYAVMQLFQESETLEEFERKLNTQDTRVNNLDLNGDNLIDYITVSDYVDGNVHNIALRVAMGRNEMQDVAVFVVQQLANGQVHIQLIGDEDLYGRNYIVEPNYDQYYGETPNPGYTGKARNVTVIRTNTYEVAAWPVIRFIYTPGYVAWRSSWYWGYYPSYWVSWRPYYWHFYYGYHSQWYPHYYSHYRHAHHVHYNRYRDFYYTSHRYYSPTVKIKIKEGNYRVTYARPDQRKAGERLYSRTVGSDRNSLRSASANGNRSSVSGDRRNSTNVGTRSASNGQVQRSTSATSRGQRQESVRSASDRKATTSVGTRSASNGQVQRSTSSTTRRTESVTQRPSANNSRGAERVNNETTRPGTSFGQPSATNGRSTVDKSGVSNRNGSVQNKSATSRSTGAVQQRPSTRQGSSTISSGRSGSQVERRAEPAVNQTKSASRSSSPAVNQTKSASRSSSPAVSRSSSSRSSDTKVSTPRSQSRSNSSVSSGRTESRPSSSGSRSSSGSSNSSRSSDNSRSRR